MALTRRVPVGIESVESLVVENDDILSYQDQGDVIASDSDTKTRRRGKTDINQKMIDIGNGLYLSMGESAEEVGSMSGTLHFITLLGLRSKPTVRRTPEGSITCPTTVGVTLISDRPIDVPVISVLKNKDTGITAQDISYRKVRKGKPFHLNMYELMFLMIRKEYAGFMEFRGDPKGVYFSPKMSYFYSGKAKLPTPTLSFKSGWGSIKEDMVEIDMKTENGWVIKPEYEKEFGALIPKKEVKQVKSRKKRRLPAPAAVSLALGKVFEENLGLEA